jgi:hypothetical protein
MQVFVLELTNNKYFVGHTYKNEFELSDFKYDKISWTKKYKPISIIDKIYNVSVDDYITIINSYTEIYGVKNVYSRIELNIDYCNEFIIFDDPSIEYETMNDERKSEIIHYIKKEFQNSCILCGSEKHIVSECIEFNNNEIYPKNENIINKNGENDIVDENKKENNEYGFHSIEINLSVVNNDETNKYTETNMENIDMDIDMDIELKTINTNEFDIEQIKKQRDYYYSISHYWYNQVYQLYYYYEQYIYYLYNNDYNIVQI